MQAELCFLHVTFLAYSSTLKMEVTCSLYETTGHHALKDSTVHYRRCENRKSNELMIVPVLMKYRTYINILHKQREAIPETGSGGP
jgi:hypothetical protein